MSVATEFPPTVIVPVRARQSARVVVPTTQAAMPATQTIAPPASRPRLRLVPPVEQYPPAPRRTDGPRRVTSRRRPTACSTVAPAAVTMPVDAGIGTGQFEAPPVRLTRRGVLASVLGVALAGGLLLLVAHLSAGSSAATPAGAPAAVVTVQPGDTLWSIAGQVSPGRDPRRVVEQIRRSNHLDSVSLTPGQTLKVD